MDQHYKILSVFVVLTCLTVPFQNCGEKEAVFSSIQVQDLGTKGGGNCVQGQRLGVWLDNNDDGNKDIYLGSFVSYEGTETAAENYNYYSASAHPKIGPTPIDNKAHVFFYDGSDGLSLNFYSNIDAGGSDDDVFDLDAIISGNNLADSVLLSDDGNELKLKSTSGDSKLYEGRFHYWNNTDGGVIGPLVTETFNIQVKVLKDGADISEATFYSSNGQSMSLSTSSAAFSSFIVGYHSYEDCQ